MRNQEENSAREPLDTDNRSLNIDLKSYKIGDNGEWPPIMNLLVFGACVVAIIYGNSFFLSKIVKVRNGTVLDTPTQTFSCEYYYCNEAAFNFINYYSYFEKCNSVNCAPTCFNYNCSNDNTEQNVNQYYSCQEEKCGQWDEKIPKTVESSFNMTIALFCLFGFALSIDIVFGLFNAFTSNSLKAIERISLCLSFFWPSFKYYIFRRRNEWEKFDFQLQRMAWLDLLILLLYLSCLGLCYGLRSTSIWENTPETVCIYLLSFGAMARGKLMSDVARPFIIAGKKIRANNLNAL